MESRGVYAGLPDVDLWDRDLLAVEPHPRPTHSASWVGFFHKSVLIRQFSYA